MRRVPIAIGFVSILIAACSGSISERGGPSSGPGNPGAPGSGNPGTPGTPGTPGSGGPPSGDFQLQAGTGASARLWRLTAVQYQNAVKDLLNVTVTTSLPEDDGAGGFGNRADLLDVSPALLETYADTAETVASQMMSRLGDLLKCQPVDAANAACVQTFIKTFGARVWRRPLAADELTALTKLHADMTARFDGNAGVSAVLQAFLTSPKFLFRSEIGDPVGGAGKRRLTPFEVAAALSFTYWNTTPDGPLMDAATAGKLSAPTDIQAMARTMLADPRARETTTDFVERWLGIQGVETAVKSTKLYPAYSPALMQSMATEARLFTGATLWDGKGGVRDLLTATTTFVDKQTAGIYGVGGTAPTTPQATALDPTQRMGILTQTAFLAAHASEDATKPVLRGKFVRENVLCQDVPAPPPNVKIDQPAVGSNQTARQHFTMHATDPGCAACHSLFDGLGFAFENYDAVGRYRTTENGQPIDATGTLVDASGGAGQPFKNALDLVQILAGSEQTYRCFTRKLFESFSGRAPVQSDQADLARAHGAFHDAGYDVKTLLSALAASDGFLNRGTN